MNTTLLIVAAVALFAIAAIAAVARIYLRQQRGSQTFNESGKSRFQQMSPLMRIILILVIVPIIVIGIYISTHAF